MSRYYNDSDKWTIQGYARKHYVLAFIGWTIFGFTLYTYLVQWVVYYFTVYRPSEKVYDVWDIYGPTLWVSGITFLLYILSVVIWAAEP